MLETCKLAFLLIMYAPKRFFDSTQIISHLNFPTEIVCSVSCIIYEFLMFPKKMLFKINFAHEHYPTKHISYLKFSCSSKSESSEYRVMDRSKTYMGDMKPNNSHTC